MVDRIFLLLLLVSAVFGCENGWTEYDDGACYKGFQEALQYDAAEAECVKHGAHLTSITTKEQAQFVLNLCGTDAYTGLKWRDDLGQFLHPSLDEVTSVQPCSPRQSNQNCAVLTRSPNDLCLYAHVCNSVQFSYVCQKGGWTPCTNPPTTTTTTKPPTTTTKPKPALIENPKRWIMDYNKGTQIHRSSSSTAGQYLHHYTIDWKKTPSGFTREAGNGFVVSVARFSELKATCPGLLKVGMWRMGAMTYIGNYPPGSFQKQEEFYCAPSQFYCGANFLLRRLDKQGGGDIFYASNENEAYQQMLGNPPGFYAANWFKETPCWIWQDYTDTWYSAVKANGGMIWSAFYEPGIVYYYTQQRHLIPADWKKEQSPPLGYVVTQNLYDSYFKTQCPDLIPMRIWHGQNGAGEMITWIGREGRNPPAVMRNGWYEEPRFYCAPTFNYCNANFMLRRMDKAYGAVSYNYPYSESDAYSQLRGDVNNGMFKNSKWSEELCYIWANWY